MFGQPRNVSTSKWDTIFEKNPKEWISFKPALDLFVYPCYSCRHMFSSKKSFQDHVNRRAILLTYKCHDCCNQTLTFYNRCSFLLHTRKHYTLQQGQLNLNDLNISTLPLGLAGFTPHPDIPLLYNTEEIYPTENIYVNAQFYSPKYSDRGKDVIILTPNDLVINKTNANGEIQALAIKQVCTNLPLCQFISLEAQKTLRQQHYLIETTEVKTEPVEDEIINTNFSLPVISKVESLNNVEVITLPKCLECRQPQKGPMTEHFLGDNRPCNDDLKCSTCRFIASTPCSLKAHLRIHDCLPPFVCPDCGREFQASTDLQKHMDDVCFHLSKNVRFRCPGKKCGKLFAMSQTYAQHFGVHMRCLFQCNVCKEVCFNLKDVEEHKKTRAEACEFQKIFDCTVCSLSGALDEDRYHKHILWHTTDRKRCMYVYLCRYCKSYFRSTQTYATHLIKCSKEKEKPKRTKVYDAFLNSKYISGECIVCHNRIIFTKEKQSNMCSKCKQIIDNRTGQDKCYCILCKMRITNEERKTHQMLCKYSRPQVLVEKLTLENIANMSFSSSSTSTSDTDLTPSKKRRSDYDKNRKRFKPKKPEVEFDLTAEKPIEFDGTYHCVLCDFKDIDREKFHEHIKIHRDCSTAYQCMECAECFVVKPSLVKHLLHFHNIFDCETYFNENDCFDETAVKELAAVVKLAPYIAKEPVKENQCKVCLQQFGDKEELNKHFRIHGMAFLMKNSI